MLLTRHYDIPDGWEPERGPDGTLLNPLPVQSLELKHTGASPEQNFSRRLIDAGVAEGWITMSKGKIVMHTTDEDLEYAIVRMPGMYCCHCDAKLVDDTSGASGRDHVQAMHGGQPSPDANNPAGFRQTHAYECVLDEGQHAKWQALDGSAVQYPYKRPSAAAPRARGRRRKAEGE